MRAFMSSREDRRVIQCDLHRTLVGSAIAEARAILAETEPRVAVIPCGCHAGGHVSPTIAYEHFNVVDLRPMAGDALADALTTFLSMEIS